MDKDYWTEEEYEDFDSEPEMVEKEFPNYNEVKKWKRY